jgi:hypothetical protein
MSRAEKAETKHHCHMWVSSSQLNKIIHPNGIKQTNDLEIMVYLLKKKKQPTPIILSGASNRELDDSKLTSITI